MYVILHDQLINVIPPSPQLHMALSPFDSHSSTHIFPMFTAFVHAPMKSTKLGCRLNNFGSAESPLRNHSPRRYLFNKILQYI